MKRKLNCQAAVIRQTYNMSRFVSQRCMPHSMTVCARVMSWTLLWKADMGVDYVCLCVNCNDILQYLSTVLELAECASPVTLSDCSNRLQVCACHCRSGGSSVAGTQCKSGGWSNAVLYKAASWSTVKYATLFFNFSGEAGSPSILSLSCDAQK